MYEALITTGNRMTVPRPVREEMGMKSGDIIGVMPSGHGSRLQIVGVAGASPGASRHRASTDAAQRQQE
jgi:bifunctional DNA-binding transcriptional regulator/antitoxin component of YhaV-PrlF toxin-antitoxin module